MSFPGDSVVSNPPVKQETQVQSLGWEDPVEKEMATNSSSLAWETMDRRALWATLYGVAKRKQTTKLFHKKLISPLFLQCSEAKIGAPLKYQISNETRIL